VYVGTADGFLVVLRAGQTFNELWRLPVGDVGFGGPIGTDITLAGGKLFFGIGDKLWQVDLANQIASECDFLAIGELLTPVVSDGLLYAATRSGFIHLVDPVTCTWTNQNINVGEPMSVKPAVANGIVYQPARFGVTAFAQDGTRLWNGPLRGTGGFAPFVQGSPSVANGLVYFGAADNRVYALDAETGDIVWEWNEDAPIISEVAITEGVVYVATSEGNVIAIAPDLEAQSNAPPTTVPPTTVPPTTVPEEGSSETPSTTTPPSTGGGGGTM
jgi:outer membrane protein assembly factor BamB